MDGNRVILPFRVGRGGSAAKEEEDIQEVHVPRCGS